MILKQIRQRDIYWLLLLAWVMWCGNVLGPILWVMTLVIIVTVKIVIREHKREQEVRS